eukprot:scaffold39849_cov52-Attheya_sp.AAC.2
MLEGAVHVAALEHEVHHALQLVHVERAGRVCVCVCASVCPRRLNLLLDVGLHGGRDERLHIGALVVHNVEVALARLQR